jgi:hypothetical protein
MWLTGIDAPHADSESRCGLFAQTRRLGHVRLQEVEQVMRHRRKPISPQVSSGSAWPSRRPPIAADALAAETVSKALG